MKNATQKNNILEFREYLENNGYSKHVIPIYIRKVKKFLEYKYYYLFSKIEHLALKSVITEYVNEIPLTSQKSIIQAALHTYYCFVSGELFIWRLSLNDYDFDVKIESEIDKFQKHLKEVHRLCDSTIISHCSTAKFFLYSNFPKRNFLPEKIAFEHVYVYLTNTLSHLSKSSKKTIISRVRSYIRFIEFAYGIKSERILKLPLTSPVWKRSSLPKYLSNLDLERLFSAYNRNQSYGIRDYAIVRCLTDLGLRCAEASLLSLDDFDWIKGSVTIKKAKSRFERTLPLLTTTGQAIELYLVHCRPETSERKLFVRYKNQKGKPMGASQVRSTVRSAAVRAGLSNFTGTHMLRHTAAKNMLKGGIDLKTIADILGHKSIETTCIYTKLDFTQLQEVAGAWPKDIL